ncbi:MAG: hypothetical protein EAX90_14160 [Candidatus Heimdallarchaeota archaeon]|nr:hypothetical protein [Candidatus Heimdallarchaeota archaeon]
MEKRIKKLIFPTLILLSLIILPCLPIETNAANPGPFFDIAILAPNTNAARNQWATLMVEQLPKIGIEVSVFDHTGWAQISPRTWGHTGPYPVPTYEEGGFDVLFVGWSWGLDWDPTGLFNTAGITPDGDNYYQYSNSEMDWAIGNYTQAFVLADRIEYAEEIQDILYEDQPQITIIYPLSLFPHTESFSGWDGLLWSSVYQSMESWTVEGATEFHYAVPADFEDFHMRATESVYDSYWLCQIYDGLVERDANLERDWGPRIAESISSSDGQIYNVALKDGVVWADGTPLTVDDIIYNYQIAVTPDLGSTDYSTNCLYWNNESVQKINDQECTIEFLRPYVFQTSNLDLELIPKHIWEGIPLADHQTTAVTWATEEPEKIFGAGPYRLHSYDPTNQVIHLEKNTNFASWFGVEPTLTDIYFEFFGSKEGAISALASGTIDMIDSQFSVQINELDFPGVTYELVRDPGTQEMGFNMEHPYFGTGELCPIAGAESAKNIRKAISHIVPREIIVEEILEGLGAPGITGMPNVAIGFNEDLKPYKYDINLALHYMKDAGFDVSPTGITGLGLVSLLSILGLIGAFQVILLKRRK